MKATWIYCFGALVPQPGVSTLNCSAYSAFNRCQPPNFIASPPTMRPMGVPLRRRPRTSKQMCHPAAPIEMKRRSMLCHSVRRVPAPKASSSHRISKPPQLYSSALGASARVTLVSETCGVGAPTVVSFTVVPTIPRLPSASKGAHLRRCAGSVSACQTFSGEWRSSLTRMSVHFSPSFCTCAPLAGPGVYSSRSVIFFSLSSFLLVLIDPYGRGGVRAHLRERTRTDGTEPARHPPPEVVQVSAGRDGAARPLWIPRNRPRAALAGALTRSAAAYEVDARSLQPSVLTRPGGSISRGCSAR